LLRRKKEKGGGGPEKKWSVSRLSAKKWDRKRRQNEKTYWGPKYEMIGQGRKRRNLKKKRTMRKKKKNERKRMEKRRSRGTAQGRDAYSL